MQTANGQRYGNGQPAWSADRVAKLTEWWPIKSASAIARLFGCLTRNAVIGKANRLKLPRKKPSGGKKKPQRVMSGPQLRQPVFYVPTLPQPILELDFLHLSIEEVRSDECHYPHGGEGTPMTFCGQLAEHGSSYCPYHRKICAHPVSTRRDSYNDFLNYRGVR